MSRHLGWIGLFILSMLFFAVTYALYKACEPFLPNTLILFFQNLCSLIIISPFALKGGKKALVTSKLPLIALRSLFGLIGVYLLTLALKTVNLSEVVLLNNSAPLYIPLIVWLWHKEKISYKLWIGLIIGFLGIFIILRPGFDSLQAGLIFGFFSGIATAFMFVVVRQIAQEPFLRILFYYFLFFCLVLSPFLWFHWALPPPIVWLYIILAAITMIGAQTCMTIALRHATAHETSPFIYTSVIFAGLIDWIFWNIKPDYISGIGMVVVIIGCVVTLLITHKGNTKKI